MSDQSQGPGWWLASDGRWYPPQPEGAAPSPTAQTVQPVENPAQPPPVQTPPGYPGVSGTVPPNAATPAPTSASGGSRRGLVIALVVLVAILLAGGVVLVATRSTTTNVAAPPTTAASAPDTTPPASRSGDTGTTEKKNPSTTSGSPPATGTSGSSVPGDDVAKAAVLTATDLGPGWTGDDGKLRHLAPNTLLEGCDAIDQKYPDLHDSGYEGATAFAASPMKDADGAKWEETVIIFPDASQAKTVMGVATDPIFESCSSTVRSVPLTIGAADELTALESTSAGVEGRILVLARRGRALVELDLTFPSGREGDRDALIAQALTTADAATS